MLDSLHAGEAETPVKLDCGRWLLGSHRRPAAWPCSRTRRKARALRSGGILPANLACRLVLDSRLVERDLHALILANRAAEHPAQMRSPWRQPSDLQNSIERRSACDPCRGWRILAYAAKQVIAREIDALERLLVSLMVYD